MVLGDFIHKLNVDTIPRRVLVRHRANACFAGSSSQSQKGDLVITEIYII